MKKKITSIILAVSIILSVFTVPVFANEDVSKPAMQTLYTVLDKTVNALVGGIAALMVTPDWGAKKDYKTPDSFLEGNSKEEFISEPAEDAKWSLGYSSNSLCTGKEVGGGDYYVGGSLSVTKKLATEQWDDQEVRVVAISDGRKINIFAVLDAYGMANTDVRAIREAFLKQYEGDKSKINSINISALHQHSCTDTFGMNGDIVSALFTSSFKNLFGIEVPSGQNKEYMSHLYSTTVTSINEAIDNMTEGQLYYGKIDFSDFIRDKREPEVYDNYFHRFRFVPDNGSKETWFVEGAMHCVGNGAAGTELTGDYPYYMKQYINENYNADFLYIEGAELAISNTDKTAQFDNDGNCTNPGAIENYMNTFKVYEKNENNENVWNGKWVDDSWNNNICEIRARGEFFAQRLNTIREETKLDPIFSVRYKETWIKIENNILVLAAKGGLLVNNVRKSGLGFEIVTEVGYAEIGKDLAVAIVPGELSPEIAFGGVDSIKNCWNGEEWEYESFSEASKAATGRELMVFGLTNDQVGYLLPNSHWHSFFTENEEIVSAGKGAGSSVASTFLGLLNEVRG